MPQSGIKGILFDAGGVLITIQYDFLAHILKSLCQDTAREKSIYNVIPNSAHFAAGEIYARPQLDELVSTRSSELTSTRLAFLKLIWKEAWKQMPAQNAPPVDSDIFLQWATRIEEKHQKENLWQRVIPGTREGLEKLKSLGLVMGVVSNADGRVEEILRKNDLHHYFSIIIDSHIEKVEKPDPEIFYRALKRAGLKAHETLYLGDFYSIDVKGSRKAGLGAVLIDPENVWDTPQVPKVKSLEHYYEYVRSFNRGEDPCPWVGC